MLGLDQKTLRPISPGADDGSGDPDDQDENEKIDRERLAWTCEHTSLYKMVPTVVKIQVLTFKFKIVTSSIEGIYMNFQSLGFADILN